MVSLPEWGEYCHTHGETYEEALQNTQEALELLVESAFPSGGEASAEGEPLPEPQTFGKTLQTV
ncbi:type II toxin-antitoxin system HicB family antitoxin [Leptolyngbya sp. FACHB-17]|uniref:type II toxin-antitoxin system HicB family antitoxin n=1 Tax=unclassified Leptolyngbya TaxID=2650499 RepID=UPI001F54FFB7|nr:type II toxin-antitoxin system HicB family antitoxin [Leptolyngbya sp. FACHB-17]